MTRRARRRWRRRMRALKPIAGAIGFVAIAAGGVVFHLLPVL